MRVGVHVGGGGGAQHQGDSERPQQEDAECVDWPHTPHHADKAVQQVHMCAPAALGGSKQRSHAVLCCCQKFGGAQYGYNTKQEVMADAAYTWF
jgi:hypothetical protein